MYTQNKPTHPIVAIVAYAVSWVLVVLWLSGCAASDRLSGVELLAGQVEMANARHPSGK